MLTQDWMMRQIETLTLAIAKIMFQKDTAEYEPHGGQEVLTAADSLHAALNALLREGRIADGEDLLFSALDGDDSSLLEVAVDFYFRLNLLSDQALEAGNFSRQEIEEGLHDVMDLYGVVLP
ncbi:DUF6483 family protein [uncultured Pseudoflavonifractor sp.]|uniref:DUF6483 family protein n=1 Tax=uncultured Pseudoflavonifractor sp. TaxID=1221379 RepID=UPI0025D9376E|nr:DUF6483 family protein [uncultured Pseudoflavonifractor sp.]